MDLELKYGILERNPKINISGSSPLFSKTQPTQSRIWRFHLQVFTRMLLRKLTITGANVHKKTGPFLTLPLFFIVLMATLLFQFGLTDLTS